jgi:hypothetical protein
MCGVGKAHSLEGMVALAVCAHQTRVVLAEAETLAKGTSWLGSR